MLSSRPQGHCESSIGSCDECRCQWSGESSKQYKPHGRGLASLIEEPYQHVEVHSSAPPQQPPSRSDAAHDVIYIGHNHIDLDGVEDYVEDEEALEQSDDVVASTSSSAAAESSASSYVEAVIRVNDVKSAYSIVRPYPHDRL